MSSNEKCCNNDVQKDEQIVIDQEEVAESSQPQFTITHGMVPDIYVPAWKTNVVSTIHDFCGQSIQNVSNFEVI